MALLATLNYDVCVWGNHWASINAAIEVQRYGKRAILLSPDNHIGTPFVNGLGATDIGKYGSRNFGNWTNREFFDRISKWYGGPHYVMVRQTPSVSEQIFADMLRYYGVTVMPSVTMITVNKAAAGLGQNITSIDINVPTIDPADTYRIVATNYVDGDEDGDLATMAGCQMFVGRESAAAYGEALAGYYPNPDAFKAMRTYADPTASSGPLVYGISADPGLTPGVETLNVNQKYGWRTPLTNIRHNMRPWPKPVGYDPLLFEWRLREAGATLDHDTGLPVAPLGSPFASNDYKPINPRIFTANGKVDLNNDSGEGGLSGEFPMATAARRIELQKKLEVEWYGFLWLCHNHGSDGCRAFMDTWGLCADEFPESTPTPIGVPNTFYRRGSKRLANPGYMMRQSDAQVNAVKADGIAMDFYFLDFHGADKIATVQSGVQGYMVDGFGSAPVEERQVIPGFHTPYNSLWSTDVPNLIVPNGYGCTSVIYSSGRTDMWKAVKGSVAGYAAAKSVATATPMQSLVVADLQTEMIALGHVITPSVP